MKRSGEAHREQPKQKRQDHSGTGQREPKRLRVTFSPYLEASASDHRGGGGATRGGGYHHAAMAVSAGGGGRNRHQEPQPRAAPQAAQSPARSNNTNNNNNNNNHQPQQQQQRGTSSPASILRMTSHHHHYQPSLACGESTTTAPSSGNSSATPVSASRFTFDFVDDNISSASSAALGDRGGKKKAVVSNHRGRGYYLSSARSITSAASASSSVSPKGVNSGAVTASCLSPSRLDPRYASRLPPSYYSPSNKSSSSSNNSNNNNNINSYGSSSGGGETPRSYSINNCAQQQQQDGTTTTSARVNNSKQGEGGGEADAEALVKRNLFGTTNTTTTTNTTDDIDMAVDDISGGMHAMDVSPRRMMGGAGGVGRIATSSSPLSGGGGGGGGGEGRRSLQNTPTSISTLGGNTATTNTYYSHQSSPTTATSTAASVVATATNNIQTFVSSSPSIRRRGLITGITSPLAGNLGRKDAAIRAAAAAASSSSSAASGMSLSSSSHHTMNDDNDDDDGNSSGMGGGWNNSNISMTTATQHPQSSSSMNYLLDYERRSGAGDRYIPSRALSNLNFELSTTGGGGGSISSSLTQRTFISGGSSNGGIVGDVTSDVFDTDTTDTMINPVPSFGATMMGGGVGDDASPSGGSGTTTTTGGGGGGGAGATTGVAAARGADAVASTFSDDGLTADRESDRYDATNRQPLLYDALLRSELLGENIDPASMNPSQSPANGGSSSSGNVDGGWRIIGASNAATPFRERCNNLRFNPSRQYYHNSMYGLNNNNTDNNGGGGISNNSSRYSSSIVNSFQLSPLSMSPNQRITLGSYTERCKRKIAKVPTKVLDAPALQDDFYLNLVDWSCLNVLAVGLGSSVYLWSAATSKVTQLCDLSPTEDAITSVAWSEGGRHLAIGITKGDVQIWDASTQKLIRTMTGHSARVGALSWKLSGVAGGGGGDSSSLLASGSRDRIIYLRDPRSDSPYEMRLCGHKQEVCGLRWSFDERSMLASGGNDNKLLIWDVKKHTTPMHAFADHTAAVKAIAWSPHQNGLLASGGGTADRCIRFWNCLTGHGISSIDTGSQVCNLAFSKNCNELVSTHGYSLNQIVVWKYPSMQKIATLTGHTYRVLYLALSPDGSTIVTGAGDETLRFWQVFPGPQKENKAGGLLFPAGMPGSIIR